MSERVDGVAGTTQTNFILRSSSTGGDTGCSFRGLVMVNDNTSSPEREQQNLAAVACQGLDRGSDPQRLILDGTT